MRIFSSSMNNLAGMGQWNETTEDDTDLNGHDQPRKAQLEADHVIQTDAIEQIDIAGNVNAQRNEQYTAPQFAIYEQQYVRYSGVLDQVILKSFLCEIRVRTQIELRYIPK